MDKSKENKKIKKSKAKYNSLKNNYYYYNDS